MLTHRAAVERIENDFAKKGFDISNVRLTNAVDRYISPAAEKNGTERITHLNIRFAIGSADLPLWVNLDDTRGGRLVSEYAPEDHATALDVSVRVYQFARDHKYDRDGRTFIHFPFSSYREAMAESSEWTVRDNIIHISR